MAMLNNQRVYTGFYLITFQAFVICLIILAPVPKLGTRDATRNRV